MLIINGHPNKDSLCNELAQRYEQGVKRNSAEVTRLNLYDMDFEINLKHGYKQRTELEPDLIKAREAIQSADKIVFVYPTWWGTMPAILKGFVDRTFLPGFAFESIENSVLWKKLLKGKSARLIVTMDTPKWYYSIIYRNAGHNIFKRNILQFCGVNPVKITTIGPVKSMHDKKINNWFQRIERLGSQLN